jgi:hypothetical protein
MDLYCVVCGGCSWNKLANIDYNYYISQCKEMSGYIKNNKFIDNERLLNNLDKYNNMEKYIDEKLFNKL